MKLLTASRLSGLVLALLALGALTATVATGAGPFKLVGTVTLKPIKTSACKSTAGKVKGVAQAYLSCTDSGVFRGQPLAAKDSAGVSYSWLWTTRGLKTTESGNLGFNLGNGVLFLRLNGTMRTIGKSTSSSGRAQVSGRWRFLNGTGAYKKRVSTGRYSLDLKRAGTRYTLIRLTLNGTVH